MSTTEDTAVEITLTGSDIDEDSLTFSIGEATNGTVSLDGAVATYTPNANFNGTDSFTYTANDGTTDSAEATITVTVTAVLNVDNEVSNNSIRIFPNPTNSVININSKIKFRQAEIYNVLGQKIFVTELDLDQIIDLSELSAGLYHLVLKNSKELKSLKILKE